MDNLIEKYGFMLEITAVFHNGLTPDDINAYLSRLGIRFTLVFPEGFWKNVLPPYLASTEVKEIVLKIHNPAVALQEWGNLSIHENRSEMRQFAGTRNAETKAVHDFINQQVLRNLRRQIDAKRISYDRIAERFDVSKTTVYEHLNGTHNLHVSSLVMFNKYFGISSRSILNGITLFESQEEVENQQQENETWKQVDREIGKLRDQTSDASALMKVVQDVRHLTDRVDTSTVVSELLRSLGGLVKNENDGEELASFLRRVKSRRLSVSQLHEMLERYDHGDS